MELQEEQDKEQEQDKAEKQKLAQEQDKAEGGWWSWSWTPTRGKRRGRRGSWRAQEVAKGAPSRSGGLERLMSRQVLHSFILTSPRWREVKDSRKESERRLNAELFIPKLKLFLPQRVFFKL